VANLFNGYLGPAGMARLIAGLTLRIEDADDFSVVRFVHTGQATTRQDTARQSTEDSHTEPLDQ